MTNATHQPPEKRRTIRVTPEPDHPVHIDLIGNDFIKVTIAENVSKEGVGICVPHGFRGYNLDTLVDILVKLPGPIDYSFSTTVKITHLQGNNFGAQFESMEKEDRKNLHAYIEKQLKKMDGDALLKMIDEE